MCIHQGPFASVIIFCNTFSIIFAFLGLSFLCILAEDDTRFLLPVKKLDLLVLITSVNVRMTGQSDKRFRKKKKEHETDHRANKLTVTGGLERECCGEERTTGGIPLAGLVPGPLPPAN